MNERTTADGEHRADAGERGQAGFWAQPEELRVGASELAYEPAFYDVAALPGFAPITGVTMQVMAGQNVMANWVRIEPNVGVPLHAHMHEQLGLVLEGAIVMTIGDESRTLLPGHAYRIPGDVPHAAVAGPSGCLVLDIFSPLREDYVAAAK